MRWLSRLLVIFVICLVAVTLPAMPVQAQGADILLSPDDGVPGEEITVYGYNFTPDEWVDIYYYQNGTRTLVAEAEADDDGDFHVDFEVPESYTGHHEVLAKDEEDVEAYDDFTVEPGLTIDPEEGTVGTTVTVLLGSLGGIQSKKRVSISHLIFNLLPAVSCAFIDNVSCEYNKCGI